MKTLKQVMKYTMPVWLVIGGLFSFIPAVAALPVEEKVEASLVVADVIPGSDIKLSSEGALSPDIEVNNASNINNTFVALTYSRDNGGVHIKSASLAQGWLSTKFLGLGTNPNLSFDPSVSAGNIVYVVWGRNDNRAIKYARCTLSKTNSPTCTSGDVVTSDTTVEDPDVAVDDNGNIHVAWTDTNGDVKTAWSTNQGGSWSTPVSLTSGADNFRRPQLAYANNILHLAYIREEVSTDPQGLQVEYRRDTSLPNHGWPSATVFAPGTNFFGGFDSVNHATIAAVGNNVYLAWQAHSGNNSGNNDQFSLIRSESTNGGGNWSVPSYITSNSSAASSADSDGLKESRSFFNGSVVPLQEDGLRPSLTISGTRYAAVWQERPVAGCPEGQNGSSEVHYSYYNGIAWTSPDTLADASSQYSIDPDLAVNLVNQERHFVFMKDDDQVEGCQGGEADAYAIYYRGPFTIVDNDEGEDTEDPTAPQPTIYLPIIRKS